MRETFDRRQALAAAEVVAIASAYIVISTSAVKAFDVGFLFPVTWSLDERSTGSGFLIGATVQIALVLLAAYVVGVKELRSAIANSLASSSRTAWTIAVIATTIHIGTALLFFVPQPERVWELSEMNLALSAIPAADGWSQEVLFRGYVILRLSRAGIPALAQILVSGALFAAIHLGYTGETAWAFHRTPVGTFMLGCFYAWAVQSGRGSLKPVIICHILIIVILQPWLAFVR